MPLNTFNIPSPRWYRITQKAWGLTENTVIALLLLLGYKDQSLTLLIIKLASSYTKQMLDMFMTNGQEYAPAGSKVALMQLTGEDTAKEAVNVTLGKGFKNEPIQPTPEEKKQPE